MHIRTVVRLHLAAALLCLPAVLHAQRPADQDKMGTGATGKQQPLPGEAKPSPSDKHIKINTQPATKPGKPVVSVKDSTAPDGSTGSEGGAGAPADSKGPRKPPDKVAYDFELPGPDGKGVPLASFKGKTLLIVNLARNSGYNTQVPALEKLNEQYKDKGLVVIGVPSNDFGAAEPGTDAEIQKVYKTDDKLTFPVMAKTSVAGKDEVPFYAFLTGKGAPAGGPVHWAFTKFIVDKTGKVVARFDPDVAPDSPEMLTTLDQVLTGRFKPKKAGGGEGDGPGGGGPPA